MKPVAFVAQFLMSTTFLNNISTLLSPLPALPTISPHTVVIFWSHAEQGPSFHHRKCGGEWSRPHARLPQSRACWPRLHPTPRACSGLLRTALKTKNTCRALTTHKHTDFDMETHTLTYHNDNTHTHIIVVEIQTYIFLHTWIHTHVHTLHHHFTFLLPLTYFSRDRRNWSEPCRKWTTGN